MAQIGTQTCSCGVSLSTSHHIAQRQSNIAHETRPVEILKSKPRIAIILVLLPGSCICLRHCSLWLRWRLCVANLTSTLANSSPTPMCKALTMRLGFVLLLSYFCPNLRNCFDIKLIAHCTFTPHDSLSWYYIYSLFRKYAKSEHDILDYCYLY